MTNTTTPDLPPFTPAPAPAHPITTPDLDQYSRPYNLVTSTGAPLDPPLPVLWFRVTHKAPWDDQVRTYTGFMENMSRQGEESNLGDSLILTDPGANTSLILPLQFILTMERVA